jgi:hypothetical protein
MARPLLLRAPMLIQRRSWIFVLASLAACSSTSLTDLASEHRAQTGSAYRACGTFKINDGTRCPSQLGAQEECMADAFAKRVPAEMPVESYTIEGDPLPQVWFVDIRDGVPILTVITDQSEDDYSNGDDFSRRECKRMPSTLGGCARLGQEDCATVETR